MEIKSVDRNVPFNTLKFGDVFLYGGTYYMKFYSSDINNASAVALKGTYTMNLNENILVSPIDGYFMVVSE